MWAPTYHLSHTVTVAVSLSVPCKLSCQCLPFWGLDSDHRPDILSKDHKSFTWAVKFINTFVNSHILFIVCLTYKYILGNICLCVCVCFHQHVNIYVKVLRPSFCVLIFRKSLETFFCIPTGWIATGWIQFSDNLRASGFQVKSTYLNNVMSCLHVLRPSFSVAHFWTYVVSLNDRYKALLS